VGYALHCSTVVMVWPTFLYCDFPINFVLIKIHLKLNEEQRTLFEWDRREIRRRRKNTHPFLILFYCYSIVANGKNMISVAYLLFKLLFFVRENRRNKVGCCLLFFFLQCAVFAAVAAFFRLMWFFRKI
jgi:hypothetical protein